MCVCVCARMQEVYVIKDMGEYQDQEHVRGGFSLILDSEQTPISQFLFTRRSMSSTDI